MQITGDKIPATDDGDASRRRQQEERLKSLFVGGRKPLSVSDDIEGVARYSVDELEACPEDPPGLQGPLVVKVEGDGDDFAPGSAEYEDWYGPVEVGGAYRPKTCRARQKVAIIVPFRYESDAFAFVVIASTVDLMQSSNQ